ncbi:amino acid adenylation domain-containing protein [Streptomyces sp. NPDC002221]|uniref:amino acid adenylation domain-containing protein n=1 Tax=Streptomyces sp. NPDC002221 TaxID=3364639 RepID=UPI00367793CD
MPPTHVSPTGSLPLTSVQRSYRIGRQDGQPLGGVGCHMYFEFDGHSVNPRELARAVEELQLLHPTLRTCFPDDAEPAGLCEQPTTHLTVHDLTSCTADERDRSLSRLRDEMSTQRLPVSEGRLCDLRLCLLPGDASRLHIDIDLLAADPPSIRILLADLADLYAGRGPAPTELDFAAHRAAGTPCDDRPDESPQADWMTLFGADLRPPGLPLTNDPQGISAGPFTRSTTTLSAENWRATVHAAATNGVDPGVVLLAAATYTLGRWSENSEFLLNLPRFERPSNSSADRIVGDFTRLAVLPFSASAAATLAALAHRTATTWNATGRGIDAPSPADVQRMAQERGQKLSPLGVVYTDLTDAPWITDRFRSILGDLTLTRSQTPQVWLDCIAQQHRGGIQLAWDAVAGILPPGTLDAIAEACGTLLTAFAEQDWTAQAPTELPRDQARTRARANHTRRPRRPRLLHQSFFEHAQADPERPALLGTFGRLSRGDVADTALRLARLLRNRGLAPGDPVVVSLRSGTDQISAVLGVLAAGGCYVPVSPDQPQGRRTAILKTAVVRFVVHDDDTPPKDPEIGHVTLADARALAPLPGPVDVPPSSPAYIIFTSGSTGAPKGVRVAHRAAHNSVADINERWSLGPEDRGILISALDFDLSVYEIFGPLTAGGALVVPDDDTNRDPDAWLKLMREHRVTLWDSVPVLLDMLISTAESRAATLPLRLVLTGGDWIGLDLPSRLRALLPECRFVACGGATEGSIYSNYYEVDHVDPEWTSIPYGRPLGNQCYRVVDAWGRDCPDWVAGELWIGGDGVADGYVNDPERTRARFVDHGGERWYRTGDLGRYRPDGNLEFLGRTDHQIKLNGYRIELGEVEAALAADPGVARGIAVVAGDNAQRRLAAYLVPSETGLDMTQVKDTAADRLPPYARPADYFVLNDVPLGSNGKTDRKALASWALPKPSRAPQDPPESGVEQTLATLWSTVLRHPVTSRHDNFFDLGGNSLLAAQLSSAIRREFGDGLPLRKVLAAPTLADMARQLGDARRQPAAGTTS